MEFVDYYKVMGVAEDASADEIKRAYRKLAKKYHPDVSKEADCEAMFKNVAEAYQVLKDPTRRQEYDQLRLHRESGGTSYAPPPGWESHAGFDPGDFQSAGANGFSDFFEEIFGQRAYARHSQHSESNYDVRGQDIHSRLSISLADAFNGATLPIELGKPSIQADGSIRTEKRVVNVKIPEGVVDGQNIRLRGQGGPAIGGASEGDFYIELVFSDDDVFTHDGKDITTSLPVAPWDAALGANVVVPTLGGNVNLKIPVNSSSGDKLRLKGRGLPGTPPGNQYVVLNVVIPPATTKEQKDFYRKMRDLWSTDVKQNAGESHEQG